MVPQNKQELIVEIERNYFLIKSDLEIIPNKNTIKKDMQGHAKGTMMSIGNLVSYLIGWGELVLKWYERKSKGESCDFPDTGYKWNELGKLAQKFYQEYEHLEYGILLAKLDNTVHEILKLVKSLDDEELYRKAWYNQWTLGRMIQFNTSSPLKNARGRLKKHLRVESAKIISI